MEGSGDGEVVENPPANLTDGLEGDELRVRDDGDALLVAYSIEDRALVGVTDAAVEVIASNDSTRHYCPGESSGVLRVSNARGDEIAALYEDDRLLPTTPCRDIGGFGTRGSIESEQWEPGAGDRR